MAKKKPAKDMTGGSGRLHSVLGSVLGGMFSGSEANPDFKRTPTTGPSTPAEIDPAGEVSPEPGAQNTPSNGRIPPVGINSSNEPFRNKYGFMDYLFAGGAGHRQAEAGNQAYFLQQSGAQNAQQLAAIQNDYNVNLEKLRNSELTEREKTAAETELKRIAIQQQADVLKTVGIAYTPTDAATYIQHTNPVQQLRSLAGAQTGEQEQQEKLARATASNAVAQNAMPQLTSIAGAKMNYDQNAAQNALDLQPVVQAAELAKQNAIARNIGPQMDVETVKAGFVPVSVDPYTGGKTGQMNIYTGNTLMPNVSSMFGNNVGNLRMGGNSAPASQPTAPVRPAIGKPTATNSAAIRPLSIPAFSGANVPQFSQPVSFNLPPPPNIPEQRLLDFSYGDKVMPDGTIIGPDGKVKKWGSNSNMPTLNLQQ